PPPGGDGAEGGDAGGGAAERGDQAGRQAASNLLSTNGRIPPCRRYSRSRGVSRRTRAVTSVSSARTVTSVASALSIPLIENVSRPVRPIDSAFSPSEYCSGTIPIISRFERWIRS